jgi:hypothetical protein
VTRTVPPGHVAPAIAGAVLACAGQVLVLAGSTVVGQIWPAAEDGDKGASRYFLLTVLTLELVLALLCAGGGAYLIVCGRRGLGAGLLAGWALSLVALCVLLLAQAATR